MSVFRKKKTGCVNFYTPLAPLPIDFRSGLLVKVSHLDKFEICMSDTEHAQLFTSHRVQLLAQLFFPSKLRHISCG